MCFELTEVTLNTQTGSRELQPADTWDSAGGREEPTSLSMGDSSWVCSFPFLPGANGGKQFHCQGWLGEEVKYECCGVKWADKGNGDQREGKQGSPWLVGWEGPAAAMPTWHYLSSQDRHFSWSLLTSLHEITDGDGVCERWPYQEWTGNKACCIRHCPWHLQMPSIPLSRGEDWKLMSFTYHNPQERRCLITWSYRLLNSGWPLKLPGKTF